MERVSRELAAIATPLNAALFIAAAVLTAFFAYAGIDWGFYTLTREAVLRPIVYAAGLGGFIAPLAVPLAMLIVALMRGDAELRKKAWSVARAVVYGLVIVAFFKAITGRAHPDVAGAGMIDVTRQFSFGFLEKGIFWGWPSSHAASSTALAVSFARSIGSKPARIAAAFYAATVCLGAAIGFHWLSDVIAGITVGFIAGHAVRRS